MNKTLQFTILLVFLNSSCILKSQSLKTDSINNGGKTGWELPTDVAFDTDGNYYITGSFAGEISIGDQLLKSNGKRDIFLAKFNEENTLQWAKNYGGTGDDNAYSLLYSRDKLYLAGSYNKLIDLSATIKLQGEGLTDVFLSQINNVGLVNWARSVKSKAPAQKAFIQADSVGNIWIAGSFKKPIQAEGGTIIGSGDKKGVYFAGFNTSGNFIQTNYFIGEEAIELNDFIINPGGQFYFAGSYSTTLTISGNSIASAGKTDGFIAKLDKSSSLLWINNVGGEFDDKIKSIAIDAEGNVYAAGEFQQEINLLEMHTAKNNTDVFIVKYNPKGKMTWSKQLGTEGESFNLVTDIEMTANSRFYLSGCFRGKIQDSPELKSAGNSKNAYIARFQTNGTRDWIMGTNSFSENKLSVNYNNTNNALFISGYFSDSFKLGSFELKNKNYKDFYFGYMIDCDIMPKVKLGEDHNFCNKDTLKAQGSFKNLLWSNLQTNRQIIVSDSGHYFVQATDKWGCISSDTIAVMRLQERKIDLGNDTVICSGTTLVLNTNAPGLPWLWSDGSTGSQLTVKIGGTLSGKPRRC